MLNRLDGAELTPVTIRLPDCSRNFKPLAFLCHHGARHGIFCTWLNQWISACVARNDGLPSKACCSSFLYSSNHRMLKYVIFARTGVHQATPMPNSPIKKTINFSPFPVRLDMNWPFRENFPIVLLCNWMWKIFVLVPTSMWMIVPVICVWTVRPCPYLLE